MDAVPHVNFPPGQIHISQIANSCTGVLRISCISLGSTGDFLTSKAGLPAVADSANDLGADPANQLQPTTVALRFAYVRSRHPDFG